MHVVRLPTPALRPFVRLLWATAAPAAGHGSGQREHVLPTGSMHLVFRDESAPLRLFSGPDDERGEIVGTAVVGGARSAYYVRDISRPSPSVGALLQPGAARLLFGTAACELAQQHTPLETLWGTAADDVCLQLAQAGEPEHQLRVLETVLAERLPRLRGLNPMVAAAIERLTLGERVGAAVGRSGYSHRHFVAVFRQEVGLTPKTYARIVRLQNALRLAAGRDSWADIALAAGYSDQAHFNRDFLAFTGMTPSAYRAIAPASANHVAVPGQFSSRPSRPRSLK